MSGYRREEVTSSILDQVLPELERISRAPTYGDLEQRADRLGVGIGSIVQAEEAKDYKAIDNDGNIWLIKNPAIWRTVRMSDGSPALLRPKKRMVLTARQAKDAAANTIAQRTSSGSSGDTGDIGRFF